MQLTPYSTQMGFGSAKIFIDAKLNSMKAIKSAQSFVSSLFDDDKADMTDPFVPNFYCYFVGYHWSKCGDNPASIIFLNFKRLKKDERWDVKQEKKN